jgi:putative sigma-54 modulation protein
MRVQTRSISFKADQKLIAFIEEKMEKLTRFFDRIQMADVVLKLENSGQVKEKIAEIHLQIPGEVLIAKAESKSFETATNTAIDSLKRQLKRYKSKLIDRS